MNLFDKTGVIHLCCICLKKSDEFSKTLYDNGLYYKLTVSIPEMRFELLNINQFICNECANSVSDIYNFRNKCLLNKPIFIDYVIKHKEHQFQLETERRYAKVAAKKRNMQLNVATEKHPTLIQQLNIAPVCNDPALNEYVRRKQKNKNRNHSYTDESTDHNDDETIVIKEEYETESDLEEEILPDIQPKKRKRLGQSVIQMQTQVEIQKPSEIEKVTNVRWQSEIESRSEVETQSRIENVSDVQRQTENVLEVRKQSEIHKQFETQSQLRNLLLPSNVESPPIRSPSVIRMQPEIQTQSVIQIQTDVPKLRTPSVIQKQSEIQPDIGTEIETEQQSDGIQKQSEIEMEPVVKTEPELDSSEYIVESELSSEIKIEPEKFQKYDFLEHSESTETAKSEAFDDEWLPIETLGNQPDVPEKPIKKKYPCLECDRSFDEEFQLQLHQVVHITRLQYACDQCNKTFCHISALNKHKRTQSHNYVKQFTCSKCNMTFSQKNQLLTHSATHTGAKNYECSECSRTFSTNEYLKKHMLTHSGLRPYKCGMCEKTFTQSSNLSRHERLHEKKGSSLYIKQ